LRPGTFSRRQS
jgi:hypothetical protein